MPALIALTLGACASSPSPSPQAAEENGRNGKPQPVNALQGGRHLAVARKIEADKGCEKAAPAYRVIAALGEGFEIAQAELGECLLMMTGANETEKALFQKEGIFWLERAAFAGEARAQRTLAKALGAKTDRADQIRALSWALVYENNADTALYGYKPLPVTFVSGLKSLMAAEELAEAEAFATDFSIIRMAQYRSTVQQDRSAQPGKRPQDSKQQRRPRKSAP